MTEESLTVPHKFVCVTNRELQGVDTIPLDSEFHPPGWWQKLSLFKLLSSPFIYFDLDVLLVDNVDYLSGFLQNDLAMPTVFTPGMKGFQSSVFVSNGKFLAPYEDWDERNFSPDASQRCPFGCYLVSKSPNDGEKVLIRGDQEYLSHFYSKRICTIPAGIVSYKIQCIDGIPKSSSVVCFHGKPDYHEVKGGWVPEFIRVRKLSV